MGKLFDILMGKIDLRGIKAAIYTFLLVVSLVAMLGRDLRPIHADEISLADPNQLAFAIETVDRDGVGDFSTSIALDSNDHPHISYFGNGDLRYARYNVSSWIFETVDSDVGWEQFCSLDLDSNGYPHISYTVGTFLKYAYFDGSSWIIQIVDSGSFMYLSISVDSRNKPHISYLDGNVALKYAHYNGSSWLIQTIASQLSWPRQSIALDSYDNPHIAYSGAIESGVRRLKHAYYDGSSWNIETVDSENVGLWVSVALDSQNNPHLSYANEPRGLKYAYFDGASWNIQIVPDSDVGSIRETSVALDSKGNPYIVYFSRSESVKVPSLLRCALYDGVSWSFKTVDEGDINNFDGKISISLDSRDFLHISYLYGGLRYARGVPPNVKLGSTISISLSSSTSYIGFKVEINGNLSYVGFKVEINGSLTFYEVGPSGAPILLSYSVTSGESWNDITLANTTSDGSYSAVWMPSATGNYLIRAVWSGNATYPRTNTTVNLVVIPFKEQNVFSVTSNSTVSELAFNSTTRELSFTVTGPSGTTGYVNVYIAKTLINNVTDVKVYLDGDQLNYTATSEDDSWLLHFTYIHSTHKIAISLGLAPFISPQLISPLSLGILALVLAVATVLLIFKIRRGTPPTILDGVFRKSKQTQIATTIGTKRHKTSSMQGI